MKPRIHGVLTHWIPGFTASGPASGLRLTSVRARGAERRGAGGGLGEARGSLERG
jgi:hypothetical protein